MKSLKTALVGLVLLTTACAAGGATEAAAPAAGPTPTTATEAQLGSIMAGYAKNAQKTIDSAGKCRINYVYNSTPADEANAMACYLDELSLGLSSGTTEMKLGELTPPASMVALVMETRTALTEISSVDLESACGATAPNDSGACSTALGARYTAYTSMDTILAKWSPYM